MASQTPPQIPKAGSVNTDTETVYSNQKQHPINTYASSPAHPETPAEHSLLLFEAIHSWHLAPKWTGALSASPHESKQLSFSRQDTSSVRNGMKISTQLPSSPRNRSKHCCKAAYPGFSEAGHAECHCERKILHIQSTGPVPKGIPAV